MYGVETLEKFMNETAKSIDVVGAVLVTGSAEVLIDANEIEVKEPVQVVKNCVPGEACEAKDYFEMITECAICGKLV